MLKVYLVQRLVFMNLICISLTVLEQWFDYHQLQYHIASVTQFVFLPTTSTFLNWSVVVIEMCLIDWPLDGGIDRLIISWHSIVWTALLPIINKWSVQYCLMFVSRMWNSVARVASNPNRLYFKDSCFVLAVIGIQCLSVSWICFYLLLCVRASCLYLFACDMYV